MRKNILTYILFTGLSVFGQNQGYKDDFNDGILNPDLSEVNYDFNVEESLGELVASGYGDGPGWGNLDFTFEPIDFSANPVFKFSLYASDGFTLRVDLKDVNGNVARGDNGLEVDIIGNVGYTDVEIDFSSRLGDIDETNVSTIVIFFNAGSNYTGTVYIDEIELGDASNIVDFSFHVNQVGYEASGPKTALLNSLNSSIDQSTFSIINDQEQVVFNGDISAAAQVEGWGDNYYYTCDFTDLSIIGSYRLKVGEGVSTEFKIGENLLFEETASSVVSFFNEMRSDDASDYTLSFNGARTDQVNVHGGWWDANGDPGKHMSHLSYANHFNPQQIPMVTWSLLKSYELAYDEMASLQSSLQDEAAFGADYMVRNLDPEGYFYLSIFDNWGGAPGSREICEWGQPGDNAARTDNYQAAFREGGGMIIAALAKSSYMGLNRDFTSQEYLEAAEVGYAHLTSSGDGYATKSIEYCNDHQENIIDDYCALMAAIELYKATLKQNYYTDALARVDNILNRLQPDGWLASDENADRPFYHAADEGLPLLSLIEFKNISSQRDSDIVAFANAQINWYKTITNNVSNPFNYVRQYRKAYQDDQLQEAKEAFFVPHNNETGYWWQGENARLGSMATAMLLASKELDESFDNASGDVAALAHSQLDWILGKNPFDICMLYGFGYKNYIDYPSSAGMDNIVGGICNGISAGIVDEDSLTFQPYEADAWQNWRWIEQWLPHDAWFMLAISSVAHLNQTNYADASFNVSSSDDCALIDVDYSYNGTYTDLVWDIAGQTSTENTASYQTDKNETITTSLYIRNQYGTDVKSVLSDLSFSEGCITSTDEILSGVKILSNPFVEGLAVTSDKLLHYTITDVRGVSVECGMVASGELIAKGLDSGVYVLSLSSGSETKNLKVVKE